MKTNPAIACAFFRTMGLNAPEPEHRFHESRRWRFDYAWIAERVALEVEGAVWINGRHSRGSGKVKDMEKYSEAACLGWRLLYVTPDKLCTTQTALLIKRALAASS